MVAVLIGVVLRRTFVCTICNITQKPQELHIEIHYCACGFDVHRHIWCVIKNHQYCCQKKHIINLKSHFDQLATASSSASPWCWTKNVIIAVKYVKCVALNINLSVIDTSLAALFAVTRIWRPMPL